MFTRALLVALVALAGVISPAIRPAMAQDGPVVVELFTSQGCSSCPPADAMLGELANRDDVIALALHVDYWDYIGWADTFADPAFTARQHGYSHAAGSTVVYTPQIVVDGVAHVAGHRPMSVAELITAHRAAQNAVTVQAVADGNGGYRVEAQRVTPGNDPVEVHLVAYLPHAVVEIARGENAGHTSNHYNIVRSWSVVADWDGQGAFTATLRPESDLPHVVLFQAAGHGAILGAARLD